MKIMAMVLFVASMTALTSCTKSNAELILGKWSLESVKATYGGTTIEMTIADLLSMYESEEISEDSYIDRRSAIVISIVVPP